jgi:hypothetical protein
VKKKLARKDYEQVIKIVNKVKNRFIAEKADSNPDKTLAQVSVLTDDDLIPLNLFDYVLG